EVRAGRRRDEIGRQGAAATPGAEEGTVRCLAAVGEHLLRHADADAGAAIVDDGKAGGIALALRGCQERVALGGRENAVRGEAAARLEGADGIETALAEGAVERAVVVACPDERVLDGLAVGFRQGLERGAGCVERLARRGLLRERRKCGKRRRADDG